MWGIIEARDASITNLRKLLIEAQEENKKKEEVIQQQLSLEEYRIQIEKSLLGLENISGEERRIFRADSHLIKQLHEKECVIRELKRALVIYRRALRAYLAVFNAYNSGHFFLRRSLEFFRPRLGWLYQHPPRELCIPTHCAKSLCVKHRLPKISIVTPSFNQANFIGRTIHSVLDQAYPDLEYYIQDGSSEDGTKEILSSYSERLAGWESRPDTGQSQAINLGFANTTGEIMAWLNSDDILFPGALDYVAKYFDEHPKVDVVYGNRILIDENDQQVGRWILPGHDSEVLSWADYVPQETLFWRRGIWEKAGGQIDESFRFAMDWDLLVRFREAGAKFAHIPRFLAAFRIHEHQKTSAVINDIGYKEMDRIRKRILGRVPLPREIRKAVLPFLLKHIAVDIAYRIKLRIGGTA